MTWGVGRGRSVGGMETSARLAVRAQVALAVLAGVVGIVLASLHTPTAGSLLAALAASAMLAAVVVATRAVAAPAARSLRIGQRGRDHTESLASQAQPAHPDTDGRVRARAPGGVVPAV